MTPSSSIPADEITFVRSHPALPAAVAGFGTWLIQNYSGNVLLNMLVSDRGRLLIGLFVAYLDVLPLPGTSSLGATLGSVQTLCRQTGVCSAGRAASLLAAMRFGGYVVPADDPDDRRRRVLRPTAKLIDLQTGNWSRQFEEMAPILPAAAAVPQALHRPSFRTAFLHALGGHFLGGFRVLDHATALGSLVESNAGLLVLVSLALPGLKGQVEPGAPVALSISALSRRFCISRAHVRKLLRHAQAGGLVAGGLLAGGPQAEQIVVLPPLTDAILSFYAALFALFHHCAKAAAREEWRWHDGPTHPISSTAAPNEAAVWPDRSNGEGRMRWYRIGMAAVGVLLLLHGGTANAQTPTAAQRDAIRQSCTADYQAACASVPTGGRAALQCLQQHMSSLSTACRSAVAAVTPGAAASTTLRPPSDTAPAGSGSLAGARGGLVRTCRGDIQALCSGVRPGGGRVLMCLQEHAAALSPRCQTAMTLMRR